jgi:hypothetical protein
MEQQQAPQLTEEQRKLIFRAVRVNNLYTKLSQKLLGKLVPFGELKAHLDGQSGADVEEFNKLSTQYDEIWQGLGYTSPPRYVDLVRPVRRELRQHARKRKREAKRQAENPELQSKPPKGERPERPQGSRPQGQRPQGDRRQFGDRDRNSSQQRPFRGDGGRPQGGFNREGGFNRDGGRPQGVSNREGGFNREGGYRDGGRPQQGGYNREGMQRQPEQQGDFQRPSPPKSNVGEQVTFRKRKKRDGSGDDGTGE